MNKVNEEIEQFAQLAVDTMIEMHQCLGGSAAFPCALRALAVSFFLLDSRYTDHHCVDPLPRKSV
jgi:hypothetical protein